MTVVIRYLPAIIVVLLMVYAVTDVAQTNEDRIRYMPKWLWVVAILFFPGLGALGWLVVGKYRGGSNGNNYPRKAPDDDPDFLRGL